MELARNPRATRSPDAYDCEFLHPKLGWIPFTAHRKDSTELGVHLYELIARGDLGPVLPYEPTVMDTE